MSICNVALGRIGVRRYIESLGDETDEAEACSVVYADARDLVLASYEWPFATKRATLASLASVEREGWTYAFALPSDCITPLRIWNGARRPRNDDRTPFTVEDNGGTPILLCDEDAPELHYVFRHENPAVYPPGFKDALAWLIAAELCLALEGKASLEQSMRQRFELALQRASAQAYNGAQADPEPDSEFISGRE